MRVYVNLDVNNNVIDVVECKNIKDAVKVMGVHEDMLIMSIDEYCNSAMHSMFIQECLETIDVLENCIDRIDQLI